MTTIRQAIEDEAKRQGDRILSRLLEESHKGVEWKVTIASYAVAAAGVMVALAAIFAVVVGFLGVTEIRRSADHVDELRREAEGHLETIRGRVLQIAELEQVLATAQAPQAGPGDPDPDEDARRPRGFD